MRNLAELLVHRREHHPPTRFGVLGELESFASHFDRSAAVAALLADRGVRPGDRLVLSGTSSPAFLTTWMALQLLGAEVGLINPAYPTSLKTEMYSDLAPRVIVTTDEPKSEDHDFAPTAVRAIDASRAHEGVVRFDGERVHADATTSAIPGINRRADQLAGFMHTSGTTGRPRWCAQSHEYFLRLGRFVADSFALSALDNVFTPLPLFHINPLGYGVIGALTGGAGLVAAPRFSARSFWLTVIDHEVTVVILHAPPAEILKRTSTSDAARSHQVRLAFFADPEFLDLFEIPIGVSGYGSTEAGGISHTWLWRRGDPVSVPEGPLRYGGRSRHDLEWTVEADGSIRVRGRQPGVLFSGYARADGSVDAALDDDGWFDTGDLGRVDKAGNLVFVERASECVRVRGEYVPVDHVERHFRMSGAFSDLAVWRRPGDLDSDEVVLFVVADAIDVAHIRKLSEDLPAFMRPALVVRVSSIPRDSGVGKVRRRELAIDGALESVDLA